MCPCLPHLQSHCVRCTQVSQSNDGMAPSAYLHVCIAHVLPQSQCIIRILAQKIMAVANRMNLQTFHQDVRRLVDGGNHEAAIRYCVAKLNKLASGPAGNDPSVIACTAAAHVRLLRPSMSFHHTYLMSARKSIAAGNTNNPGSAQADLTH
jgi:hypothetical protein